MSVVGITPYSPTNMGCAAPRVLRIERRAGADRAAKPIALRGSSTARARAHVTDALSVDVRLQDRGGRSGGNPRHWCTRLVYGLGPSCEIVTVGMARSMPVAGRPAEKPEATHVPFEPATAPRL